MVQSLVDAIVNFVRDHQSWAPAVAFLVAFGESLCFLSIIWPGAVILVGVTGLLAAGQADVSIVLPSVIGAGLGGTLGYALSYWIGIYFKDSIANIWPFTRQPELIPRGKVFFDKYGAWSVFFGHFFGPIRAVIPVVAGMFGMRQLPFQIANIVSAFIWALGVIAPTFFAVTFKEDLFAFLRGQEIAVAAVMFVLAFLNALPAAIIAIPTLIGFVALGGAYLLAGGDLITVFIAGALGAFAGDLYGYFTGSGGAANAAAEWAKSWSSGSADRARGMASRFGAFSLLPSKFHTSLRSLVPLAAGAAKQPLAAFLIMSALGAALWAAVLLSPRYLLAMVMSM
jgi:membrane protein DedA with SNARE-associated domain